MPNYDYQCTRCGKTFEVFQSMKDPRLEVCPDNVCGDKGPVKRLLGTGAGFIFKGSGFYATDYRSASYREGAKKESGADKPAAAKEGKASSTCCSGGACQTKASSGGAA